MISIWKMLRVAMRFFVRFVFGTGAAFFIIVGLHVGYLQLMPMSHWVDFKGVKVVETNDDYLVLINRVVNPDIAAIPVTTLAKMFISLTDGVETIPGCSRRLDGTVETESDSHTYTTLNTLLPQCDFEKLDDKKLQLQLLFKIELPYTIVKTKRWITAPFTYHEKSKKN